MRAVFTGNIGTVEDFLTKAQKAGLKVMISKAGTYDTDGEEPGRCILAMRPENI